MQQEGWWNRERIVFSLFAVLAVGTVFDFYFKPGKVAKPGEPMLKNATLAGEVTLINEKALTINLSSERRDPFVPFELSARTLVRSKPRQGRQTQPKGSPRIVVKRPAPPPPETTVILKPKPVKAKLAATTPSVIKEKAYVLPISVKGIIQNKGTRREVLVSPIDSSQYFTMAEGDEFKGALLRKITSEGVTFENEMGDRLQVSLDSLRAQVSHSKEEAPKTEAKDNENNRHAPSNGEDGGDNPSPNPLSGLPELLKNKNVQQLLKGRNPKTLSIKEMSSLLELAKKHPELSKLAKQFIKQ